jgi:16S rRNA (adenine1518-N6/adenine1519-N6)-dimethyltransferase
LVTTEIPHDVNVIVANLPYNTSVPIVLHLLATLPSLTRVLVMVQAEVAERLAAGPGSKAYGGPSVKAAWYGTWSIAGTVSRQVFWPVPNVDSLLVAMEARPAPGDDELRQVVWDLVDYGFATRRKMSRGALASYLGPDRVSQVITAAGLNPEDRGEAWSLEGYVALAHTWLAMR